MFGCSKGWVGLWVSDVMLGEENVFEEGPFGNFTTIYNLLLHTLSPYQTSGTISLNKMKLKELKPLL